MNILDAYHDIQTNKGNHAKEYWHDGRLVNTIISTAFNRYIIRYQNGRNKLVNRLTNVEVIIVK